MRIVCSFGQAAIMASTCAGACPPVPMTVPMVESGRAR